MSSNDPYDLAIQRLKQIGGPDGQVTLDQVKSVLPVDEMTPGEIGQVMIRLEEAGVEVCLEEDLLRPGAGPANDDNIAADPTPVASDPAVAPTVPRAIPSKVAAPHPGTPSTDHGPSPRPTARSTLAVVVVLAVLGIILLYALMA